MPTLDKRLGYADPFTPPTSTVAVVTGITAASADNEGVWMSPVSSAVYAALSTDAFESCIDNYTIERYEDLIGLKCIPDNALELVRSSVESKLQRMPKLDATLATLAGLTLNADARYICEIGFRDLKQVDDCGLCQTVQLSIVSRTDHPSGWSEIDSMAYVMVDVLMTAGGHKSRGYAAATSAASEHREVLRKVSVRRGSSKDKGMMSYVELLAPPRQAHGP